MAIGPRWLRRGAGKTVRIIVAASTSVDRGMTHGGEGRNRVGRLSLRRWRNGLPETVIRREEK